MNRHLCGCIGLVFSALIACPAFADWNNNQPSAGSLTPPIVITPPANSGGPLEPIFSFGTLGDPGFSAIFFNGEDGIAPTVVTNGGSPFTCGGKSFYDDGLHVGFNPGPTETATSPNPLAAEWFHTFETDYWVAFGVDVTCIHDMEFNFNNAATPGETAILGSSGVTVVSDIYGVVATAATGSPAWSGHGVYVTAASTNGPTVAAALLAAVNADTTFQTAGIYARLRGSTVWLFSQPILSYQNNGVPTSNITWSAGSSTGTVTLAAEVRSYAPRPDSWEEDRDMGSEYPGFLSYTGNIGGAGSSSFWQLGGLNAIGVEDNFFGVYPAASGGSSSIHLTPFGFNNGSGISVSSVCGGEITFINQGADTGVHVEAAGGGCNELELTGQAMAIYIAGYATILSSDGVHVEIGPNYLNPTIASMECGTTTQGAVSSTSADQAGAVTVGTTTVGGVTSCHILWSKDTGWIPNSAPVLSASSSGFYTAQPYVSSFDATGFTITGVAMDNLVISWNAF